MGVLQTLERLVGEPVGDPYAALQDAYAGLVTRARLLARHAERAPQAHGQEALQQLADAEAGMAQRVAEALRAAGRVAAAPVETVPPPGALNHWARLVQVLEAHRAAERQTRELAVRYADAHPDVAAVFDELCHTEQAHGLALRALIARADPHALD